MIYGPAYKGIPLATGTAIALAEQGHNVPYCYNRKRKPRTTAKVAPSARQFAGQSADHR